MITNLKSGKLTIGNSSELYKKIMAEYRKQEIKEWIVKIFTSGVISK